MVGLPDELELDELEELEPPLELELELELPLEPELESVVELPGPAVVSLEDAFVVLASLVDASVVGSTLCVVASLVGPLLPFDVPLLDALCPLFVGSDGRESPSEVTVPSEEDSPSCGAALKPWHPHTTTTLSHHRSPKPIVGT